ncbi:hypothetical protein FAM09_25605 [Niastella caeni]|uniref:Uncharacterized protein n=1 Tax=Niastella caeni TaxID=2569763 RepID=A0A4S8HEU2_9BACT|nr:hypothetical protein [Niastella caeni]THU33527.1 hypothetical protein FAM09_25605 [Niastella caeni]
MRLIVNWGIPILCALYLSLFIGQYFSATAFRYLFPGFLFLFIFRFYIKTFSEKHAGEPVKKKGLIAGIVLSAIIVWAGATYLVPEVIRINRVAQITLTALGKKNEKSHGFEIWLRGVDNNGSIDLSTVPLDRGWKRKDNNLYAAESFPATLHIRLDHLSRKPSLLFLKHDWSGIVQVSNGNQQDVVDLYAATKEDYKYPLDVKQAVALNDSTANHLMGYILAFLFYSVIFYFLLVEIGGKQRVGA